MLKRVSITSICILLLLQIVGGSLVLAASPVNHLNLDPRAHTQQEKINPQPQRIKEATEEINNLLIEEDWDVVAPELIDYEFVDWFAVSATALNIDEDALWEALASGQNLSEIAAAQGVDVQSISDAILAAEQSLAPVLVDPTRIAQVLGNLIANALKHTPHGGSIRIHCWPDPDPGYVRTSVSDNGIGIPEADLPHIFERHHGEIWVKSQAGKGSTFEYRLPVVEKTSTAQKASK